MVDPSSEPPIATDITPPEKARASAARPRNRIRRGLARLLGILHGWAESGWSGPAAGTWGVLQGSVVPGPTDTLLIPFGLADPARVWRLAIWALAGATMGGLIAYAVGALAFDEVGRPALTLMGIGHQEIARSAELFAEKGWMLVTVSSFSPISTKLVCIAAGAFGVPFGEFALALAGGRAIRFALVALAVRFAGERLMRWLGGRAGAGR